MFWIDKPGKMDKTIVDRVEELSVKYNATMMQISLAWCIAKV